MTKWIPQACDEKDCLRVAVEKVYMSNPARIDYLCEKHLAVHRRLQRVQRMMPRES